MGSQKSRLRCVVLEIRRWSRAALSALYIVLPIDLIPDFIAILGSGGNNSDWLRERLRSLTDELRNRNGEEKDQGRDR